MSYVLRLACVCLAAFFLINFAVGVLALAWSRAAVRLTQRMRPAVGARMLLGLRLMPVTLALLIVVGCCIPSYLRFEQDGSEDMGVVCLALGLAGLLLVVGSIHRAVATLAMSARIAKAHESAVRPFFALVGLLKPRVIISEGVRQALSAPQLEAALLHEAAHKQAHDNIKRFAMIAAPGLLPFRSGFKTVESGWVRLSEWAADDSAIAAKPMLAIALAEALVRVARVANVSGEFTALSSFVGSEMDLGERVERLLNEPTRQTIHNKWLRSSLGSMAAVFVAAAGAAITHRHGLLYGVHCAMERLVH